MFFEIINPCNIAQTIFSIEFWYRHWSTKKTGSKKSFHLGEQFTQTQRPTLQNGGNSSKNFRKIFSRKLNENFEKSFFFWFFEEKKKVFIRKIKKFDFWKFSLNFRKQFFRKIFGRICPILQDRSPCLSELISKLGWFFCSRFFCTSRSIQVVLGKNCLGLRGARSAAVVEQVFFSLGIFTEGTFHLPGERELIPPDRPSC